MGLRAIALVSLCCLFPSPAAAQRLPDLAVPDHYDLAFTVDISHSRFDGVETVQMRVVRPTTHIVLNAAELEFRSASLESAAGDQKALVSLAPHEQQVTFTVQKPIPAGVATLKVAFVGTLNDKLRGFYLSHGAGRDYAVSQMESTDARRAFPCFDEPKYKATFSLTLTIDRGDVAISNGRVIADTPGPGERQHTVKFSPSPKMSSYLVAIAVGDFACIEGAADSVPIRVCATPDKRELTHLALDSAQEILKFYDRYYSIRYPFGKLDVLAVPDFAAGAMENTAAIFYRESDLLADSNTASVATRKNIASVLAHEMAHQWFGNLVTMQWWNDLWLNEGFATWMANRPLEAMKPEWNIPVDEARETERALTFDSLGSTHPIRVAVETPEQIDAAFDEIAYEKAAAVLRMVEHYVGAEAFRRGVNTYLEEHAYANATAEDFWTTLARSSGRPVDKILATFTSQAGAPLLDVGAITCDSRSTSVPVSQDRFSVDARDSSRTWQIPICFRTGGPTEPETCTVLASRRASLAIGPSCRATVFANAGASGYYRTEYPPTVLHNLSSDPETLLSAPERLSLIADEWALVEAGRQHIGNYLSATTGFGAESSSGVLQEVVERLGYVDQYVANEGNRDRLQKFVEKLFRPLADRLGWRSASGENDDHQALRATTLLALGTIGNDGDIVARARQMLTLALSGGPPLDPTLASAVVTIAARHGDRALYDQLASASAVASSPDERNLYLYAAADFPDPGVIDAALQQALGMRSQDMAIYLESFLKSPSARPHAWTFVKEHWSELASKLDVFGGEAALFDGLSAFCDAKNRDDIKAFFAVHKPSDAAPLPLTLEQIDACIGLSRRESGNLESWLANQ